MECGSEVATSSQGLQVPRVTSSRVPTHSRETIFSTSLTTTPNPRRELKPMHQMQWQEHTKCSSPSLSNPTKATKAMEEYERKNKEKHQELQDLDPQGSPHLEEIWLGGECRSRSPLSFPSKRSKNHRRERE